VPKIPSFVGHTPFLLAESATPIVSIPLVVVVVVAESAFWLENSKLLNEAQHFFGG
jgi:hypothetical protein